MDAPEYLICINCECPCYVFEWRRDRLTEILCEVCGNEEIDEFATEEEWEALMSASY